LPSLAEARNDGEQSRWLGVCIQMVLSFRRTLPLHGDAKSEWHYDHWRVDEGVFEVIARRMFEIAEIDRRHL